MLGRALRPIWGGMTSPLSHLGSKEVDARKGITTCRKINAAAHAVVARRSKEVDARKGITTNPGRGGSQVPARDRKRLMLGRALRLSIDKALSSINVSDRKRLMLGRALRPIPRKGAGVRQKGGSKEVDARKGITTDKPFVGANGHDDVSVI